jgi:hypothetical protein
MTRSKGDFLFDQNLDHKENDDGIFPADAAAAIAAPIDFIILPLSLDEGSFLIFCSRDFSQWVRK